MPQSSRIPRQPKLRQQLRTKSPHNRSRIPNPTRYAGITTSVRAQVLLAQRVMGNMYAPYAAAPNMERSSAPGSTRATLLRRKKQEGTKAIVARNAIGDEETRKRD